MPKGTSVLDSRFFPAIKNEGTKYKVSNARFTIQGYHDYLETLFAHNTTTAKQSPTKILLVLPPNAKSCIFTTDATQACLQGAE